MLDPSPGYARRLRDWNASRWKCTGTAGIAPECWASLTRRTATGGLNGGRWSDCSRQSPSRPDRAPSTSAPTPAGQQPPSPDQHSGRQPWTGKIANLNLIFGETR